MCAEDTRRSRKKAGQLKELVLGVAELLREKRARDILVLELGEITTVTDYFIICTVKTGVQIRALARFVEEMIRSSAGANSGFDIRPMTRSAGYDSPWVLLDYNYFVIHFFLKEGREYYQLEKLWHDAKVLYSHEGDAL